MRTGRQAYFVACKIDLICRRGVSISSGRFGLEVAGGAGGSHPFPDFAATSRADSAFGGTGSAARRDDFLGWSLGMG